MNKGPHHKIPHLKKDKSKIKTKANIFLADDDTRNAIMLSILSQLDNQSLEESGSLFEVAPNPNQPALIYNVLVTISPQTKEIEFHMYNPVDPSNQLGEGAQGKVIVAQNMVTGNLVAVKIQSANGMTFEEDLMRERRNLQITKKLVGIASNFRVEADGSEWQDEYTLMQYCAGGNLNHYLYEIDKSKDKESPEYFAAKKTIDIRKKLHIVILVLKQVIELHDKYELAHRDIKTDNFVISDLSNLILNLIDLGSAIQYGPNMKESDKTNVGTFGYVAPEILEPISTRPYYNFACDYWALGVVIAEILTSANYQAELRKMMLAAKSKDTLVDLKLVELHKMMPDVFGSSTDNTVVWKELTSLVTILLQEQAEMRPSLEGLKDMRARLYKLYLEQPLDVNVAFEHYKAMKRQHTLATLPRLTREPVSLGKKHKDKKEKPKLSRSTTLKTIDSVMQGRSKLSEDDPSLQEEVDKLEALKSSKVRKKRSVSTGHKKRLDKMVSSSVVLEKTPEDIPTEMKDITTSSDEDIISKRIIKPKRRKKTNQENSTNTNALKGSQLENEQVLSILLEKFALTEESSSSPTDSVVPARERALLSVFSQKARHVRGLSGDVSGFQTELESLQKMAESLSLTSSDNSTIIEKVTDVKKSCQRMLKNN
ncbi:protein kinase [Candidatus Berkiella cookevillensis]|uniref:Protein kinase n=1 Tax=Candidatus Berkiella cookevillensis TaxID=437022 RepID=A0A0Q9YN90_9GAMM|nr:protein kinase [Candidatus Berkiella cookevillensis]MCS5709329.1 protein kinase [Candidatus Berkiella cookevillensis]